MNDAQGAHPLEVCHDESRYLAKTWKYPWSADCIPAHGSSAEILVVGNNHRMNLVSVVRLGVPHVYRKTQKTVKLTIITACLLKSLTYAPFNSVWYEVCGLRTGFG